MQRKPMGISKCPMYCFQSTEIPKNLVCYCYYPCWRCSCFRCRATDRARPKQKPARPGPVLWACRNDRSRPGPCLRACRNGRLGPGSCFRALPFVMPGLGLVSSKVGPSRAWCAADMQPPVLCAPARAAIRCFYGTPVQVSF
jgi:hypothetical protein